MSFYFGKSVESTKTFQFMKELSRLMFLVLFQFQFNQIWSDWFRHDWFQLSRKNQFKKNHALKAPHKVANQMLLLKIKCYCYRSQINIFSGFSLRKHLEDLFSIQILSYLHRSNQQSLEKGVICKNTRLWWKSLK